MKPLLFASILVAVLVVGLQKKETPKVHPVAYKQRADTIRIVRVQFVGLKEGDRQAVARVLLETPGILSMRFTGKNETLIRFDLAKISLKQLEEAIHKAGYTPWFH